MKFVAEKSVLVKEVSVAQEIISSRTNISIISNLYLSVQDGTLTLRATDLKVAFESRLPVTEISGGSTTVFCDKFLGVLRSLPDGEIQFEVNEGGKMQIQPTNKSVKFQLKTMAADKFPEPQSVAEDQYFPLAQSTLLDMITQTIFAVSDDESRYFMNGVYLERREGKLIAVATDGRRLSYIEKNLDLALPDQAGIIIPPKVLTLLRKLASGQGSMSLAVVEKNIFFKFDNQNLSSNLIDAQFPNYQRVIPDSHAYEFYVKRDEFSEAIKRVSLLVEQKNKRIFLTMADGNLSISSEESEMGSANENIPADYTGPQVTLAVNFAFLLDPLRVISDEKIHVQFSDSKKAMKLSTEPAKDYFHIVMPMQLD